MTPPTTTAHTRSEAESKILGGADGRGPICVRHMRLSPGLLVCDVQIEGERYRYSTPALAQHLTESFPELPSHACVNGKDRTLSAVMDSTSTAHLLEHLVISLQTRRSSEQEARFVGTTEWVDEPQGLAKLCLSFRDDLEALSAFNEGLKIMNRAMLTCKL